MLAYQNLIHALQALSAERKAEIDKAIMPKNGIISWSDYDESAPAKSTKDTKKK